VTERDPVVAGGRFPLMTMVRQTPRGSDIAKNSQDNARAVTHARRQMRFN